MVKKIQVEAKISDSVVSTPIFNPFLGKKISKITAACFDGSQRRLCSAGADGIIKIWNFSNGQEISKCEPSNKDLKNPAEVTDLCFVYDSNNPNMNMGYVLSVGWSKKVYCYLDEKEEIIYENNIMPPSDQGIKHDDDIMTVTYSAQDNLVFTGSHEGKLIAWNFETKRAKYELHLEDKT